MQDNIILITVAVLVALGFAFVLGANLGPTPEDLDKWEECIQDRYGMSSTEYYQMTGMEPVCNSEDY